MSTSPHTSLRIWAPTRPGLLHVVFGLTACGAIAATYSLAALAGATSGSGGEAKAARPAVVARATPKPAVAAAEPEPSLGDERRTRETPPTASEFVDQFFGAANAYAAANGQAVRLGRAHCVQASPGHYMCSYESRKPGEDARCHIVQARWTPDAESAFTVTLAGRVARCESLRAALHSLR